MSQRDTLDTHLWSESEIPHIIHQDGRTIYHQRCVSCGRDFGQGLNGAGWQAVYVGILRIELLAESVDDRWLTQRCPGKPFWIQDQEDRKLRRN
jgi:hypothetical protein